MKRLSALLLVFVLFPFSALAQVSINEVAWMGTTHSSNDEWIELANDSGAAIDLKGWALAATDGAPSITLSGTLTPQGFFLLERTDDTSVPDIKADLIYTGALVDGGELLVLKNAQGQTIQTLDASAQWPGGDKDSKWTMQWLDNVWITSPPTPKNPNQPAPAKSETHTPLSTVTTPIRLNEILGNPSGAEGTQEFIELYNTAEEDADLSGWSIKDAAKTSKPYIFPAGTLLKGKAYLTIYRSTFLFALNNTSETVSLFNAAGALADTVTYDSAHENVSYNFSDKGWPASNAVGVATAGWRHSRTLTPGIENVLNQLPEAEPKIPKKAYVNMLTAFGIKTADADGDTTKVTWDFGDKHKSFKAKTTHRYEKTGTYRGTVTVFDGSEETVTSFKVKVTKYPRPEVRIVRFAPNAPGRDTETEWIELENRSSKTVNLKDWKIATGWKKLVNHTVLEDFSIKPGATRKLTRADSRFTLNNQKLKLELRTPDGKTLQKISYKRPDNASEEEVFVKMKGEPWRWEEEIIPETTEVETTPVEPEIPVEEAVTASESQPEEANEIISGPLSLSTPEIEALYFLDSLRRLQLASLQAEPAPASNPALRDSDAGWLTAFLPASPLVLGASITHTGETASSHKHSVAIFFKRLAQNTYQSLNAFLNR